MAKSTRKPRTKTGSKSSSSSSSSRSASSESSSSQSEAPKPAMAQGGGEMVVPLNLANGQRIEVVIRIDVNVHVRTAEPTAKLKPKAVLGIDDGVFLQDAIQFKAVPLAVPLAVPSVFGGMTIRRDLPQNRLKIGTAGIGCWFRTAQGNKRVLLTANHVVGDEFDINGPIPQISRTVGRPVKVGGTRSGVVTASGSPSGAGHLLDAALVQTNDGSIIEVGRVSTPHQDFFVSRFGTPTPDMAVIHCGILSGGTEGIVEEVRDPSDLVIENRCWPGNRFTPSGLMRLGTGIPGVPFASFGDSGGAVLSATLNEDGMYTMIGMLIAADPEKGYAYPMLGDEGVAHLFRLTATEPLAPNNNPA